MKQVIFKNLIDSKSKKPVVYECQSTDDIKLTTDLDRIRKIGRSIGQKWAFDR